MNKKEKESFFNRLSDELENKNKGNLKTINKKMNKLILLTFWKNGFYYKYVVVRNGEIMKYKYYPFLKELEGGFKKNGL